MNNIVVVGSKKNHIYIGKYQVNKSDVLVNDIFEIKLKRDCLLQQCMFNKNKLLMLDSLANSILQYNLLTKELKECYTGKDPRHLCRCGNNIYVTNFESDSISIIDKEKFNLIGTLNVGIKPHGIISNYNNDKIYIACYEQNYVVEYNIVDLEKKFINLKCKPMHLVYDNNVLYVLSYILNKEIITELIVVDINKGNCVDSILINGLTDNFFLDKNTNKIYVNSIKHNVVFIIDLLTNSIEKELFIKGYLQDVYVDNKNIYILNSDTCNIEIFDKKTYENKKKIELQFSPKHISSY